MNKYEVVFILRADLSEEDNKAIVSRFFDSIAKNGGLLTKIERWGNRKLAYLIDKQSRGYYTLWEVISDVTTIKELERLFRIEERVLRYLVVILQKAVKAEEVEAAKELALTLDTPPVTAEVAAVETPQAEAVSPEQAPAVVNEADNLSETKTETETTNQ
ncbi:MAG: 30S ribosomal protein S6 [Deltaproteobacteria bacterium]|nr:30S ribosomal protein S6 [Deltaproteobacteria bacterium]